MSELTTLTDALIEELKDIYNSEHQIVKALPKMAKKAIHPKLKAGFELHLSQTQDQIERLNQISEILGQKLTGKVCKATSGLIEEGKEVLEEECENKAVLDSLLIGAARRVEHYEIAAYSSALAMSEALGLSKITKLLKETLAEEVKTDSTLSDLATKEVLPKAHKEMNE